MKRVMVKISWSNINMILDIILKEEYLKLCSDYELTKDLPKLTHMGEIWEVFSEFFFRKDPASYQKCAVKRFYF